MAGPRRESTQPGEPQPPLYRSPTLKALLARVEGQAAGRFLDLHAAVGSNVEFLSRFASRLQIVDLLAALGSEDLLRLASADPPAALERALPPPAEPFDVVLAWDVPNYLTREQLTALSAHLGRICRPGALMLAFVSTAKEIPDRPTPYKIVDEQTLRWEPRSAAVRPSPRFPPAEVERMTSGFVVVHSVLMRHGVREYLFARRASKAADS